MNTKKGFTLIELLVVISIVALLSSVILASLNTARARARDSQRLLIAREIFKANELRFSNNGTFAATRGYLSNSGALAALNADLAPYLTATIPTSDLARYMYLLKNYLGTSPFSTCLSTAGWVADSQKYAIYVQLENAPTSNSNYISATQGDAYDRCIATVYNMNLRFGN